MIIFHQWPAVFGLPSFSPFCMKLETWLRLAGLPYEMGSGDYSRAPKGKMPYIELDGDRIGDSAIIIDYLEHKLGVAPDAHLDDAQRTTAHVYRRMLEEHTYWNVVEVRYRSDAHWAVHRAAMKSILPPMPPEVADQFLARAREVMMAQLHAQGMGRHSADEAAELGLQDMRALDRLLGDKPFFFGDRPSSFDCVAYGTLANLRVPAFDSPLVRWVRERPSFTAFCDRMHARFFPPAAAV